jgi:hypothetical protein
MVTFANAPRQVGSAVFKACFRVEQFNMLKRIQIQHLTVGMYLHDMIYARSAVNWPKNARERIKKHQVSLLEQ